MTLLLWTFRCSKCGEVYESLGLPEWAYGEFLMRSPRETAYLNALDDCVYQEVADIMESLSEMRSVLESHRADLLQAIFGYACDTDSDGAQFSIGRHPPCPNCGSCEPESWQTVEPIQWIDYDLPHITHQRWYALDKRERRSLVCHAIHAQRDG